MLGRFYRCIYVFFGHDSSNRVQNLDFCEHTENTSKLPEFAVILPIFFSKSAEYEPRYHNETKAFHDAF